MNRLLHKILSAFLILTMLFMLASCGDSGSSDELNSLAPGEEPQIKVEMADGSTFIIELYPQYAPETVANFVSLVEKGFYDGLEFHRVNSGLAQGGDAHGQKSVNKIKGEFSSNGFDGNTLKHERGVISMARTNDPDSATSQFFICYTDLPSIDGNYAAFGKVIDGMDVVDSFKEGEFTMNSLGEMAVPVEPIVIKKMVRLK